MGGIPNRKSTNHACLNFALEQFAALDSLRCRRMFGGFGLRGGELFSGIVHGVRLYFKRHPETLPDYLSHHATIFAPPERQLLRNCRKVPVDIPENAGRLTARSERAARP